MIRLNFFDFGLDRLCPLRILIQNIGQVSEVEVLLCGATDLRVRLIIIRYLSSFIHVVNQ